MVAKSMTALLLPPPNDFEPLILAVTNSVAASETRRAYRSALLAFCAWHAQSGRLPLERATVHAYRAHLQGLKLGRSRINQALSAITKLAKEAEAAGVISYATYAAIKDVDRIKTLGEPAGNWLDEAGVAELVSRPAADTLIGKRDRALLALMVGTGMRVDAVSRIQLAQFVEREDRTVILDSIGKGGKIITVPVHDLAADYTREWIAAAKITEGPLLRAVTKSGLVGEGLSKRGIHFILTERYGEFGVAPHDLRRTIARIMADRGAPLRAIQHQLGHSSSAVTERYINAHPGLKRGIAGVDYWSDPRKSRS